jgi:hypothetical protein
MITNGCYIYLKPLFNGSFALGIYSTNAGSTNVTLNFSALNGQTNTIHQSWNYMYSPGGGFDVYDCLTNGYSFRRVNDFTTATIASHEPMLFRIDPPTSEAFLSARDVQASDGWTRIDYENYWGPIAPAAWYVREGWRCGTTITYKLTISIPDWVTQATVTHTIGCDAVAAWTNDYSPQTINLVSGNSQVGGTNVVVPVYATNGAQNVSATCLWAANTRGQPKYLIEFWAASTNTTATRAIIATKIEYR